MLDGTEVLNFGAHTEQRMKLLQTDDRATGIGRHANCMDAGILAQRQITILFTTETITSMVSFDVFDIHEEGAVIGNAVDFETMRRDGKGLILGYDDDVGVH